MSQWKSNKEAQSIHTQRRGHTSYENVDQISKANTFPFMYLVKSKSIESGVHTHTHTYTLFLSASAVVATERWTLDAYIVNLVTYGDILYDHLPHHHHVSAYATLDIHRNDGNALNTNEKWRKTHGRDGADE